MLETARAYDVDARRARAGRILDAAVELLQRWGYKRLTMDDVAQRVGIGKGTLYLHWKTREGLFEAAIMREITALVDEFVAAVRADPRQAMPHLLARTYYLAITRRPLLRAFFTADLDMLGKLAAARSANGLAPQMDSLRQEYARMLVEQRVLREAATPEEVTHVFRAIILGFVLSEPLLGELTAERKADLLMEVVARSFGMRRRVPAATLRVIALSAIGLFTAAADNLQAQLAQAYE